MLPFQFYTKGMLVISDAVWRCRKTIWRWRNNSS